jgi:hypothetical protein
LVTESCCMLHIMIGLYSLVINIVPTLIIVRHHSSRLCEGQISMPYCYSASRTPFDSYLLSGDTKNKGTIP